MPTVSIPSEKILLKAKDGQNLMNFLQSSRLFLETPCNGKGTCGKCRVQILSNPAFTVSDSDRLHLKESELNDGIRLACTAHLKEDCVLEILRKKKKTKILTTGYRPRFTPDPNLNGYGIAVDIGTTTVILALVELATGNIIAESSMLNPQTEYGLDVLTRITYEVEQGESGIAELQKAIVSALNEKIDKMLKEIQISENEIREIAVASNTTMAHLLLGADARNLGRFPYTPSFTKAQRRSAAGIGIHAGKDTQLYVLPQVSAFIGADIVAGAYVAELEKTKGNTLFIDIGTNGEIVLATEGRLLCCSCAAGPALEGMNISCGMRAEEGAIEEITLSKEGVSLQTIEGGAPAGFCGSGILSVLKELLQHGLIRNNGTFIQPADLPKDDYRLPMIRMNGKKREFLAYQDPELVITQSDIRQIQLAKGAILSGFTALLRKADLTMNDLDRVLVAGQFGAHLPAESLVGTGILPEEVKDKITYLGNSAITGAYMSLMSRRVKEEMIHLANKMEYVELAIREDYEMIFRASLTFPATKSQPS